MQSIKPQVAVFWEANAAHWTRNEMKKRAKVYNGVAIAMFQGAGIVALSVKNDVKGVVVCRTWPRAPKLYYLPSDGLNHALTEQITVILALN